MNWRNIVGAILIVIAAVVFLYVVGMSGALIFYFDWNAMRHGVLWRIVLVLQFLIAGAIGLAWAGAKLIRGKKRS